MANKNQLNLKPYERIIFPLDLPTLREARKYITLLKNHVGVFKIGLELFVSEGPKVLKAISDKTRAKIFLDLKFHDIPETVRRAQKAANEHKVDFLTVHCGDGTKLLRAVAKNAKKQTKVLGVTVLTSLSKDDLNESGIKRDLQNPLKLALYRANLAKKAGCYGIVCSGKEVKAIKDKFRRSLITVVPGVRPVWGNVSKDDQARITTPYEAINSGADYIVIGRPIRDAKDPREAAERITEEIKKAEG